MSGRRVYDPSKLHLKKELTQIKKSAKALRDPGTSSSLRSPLTATRSVTTALLAQKSISKLKKSPFSVTCKEKEREKGKRSVLYNWRGSNKKSSSEKSLPGVDLGGGNHNNDGVDGSSNSARLDDCLSDARNGGCAGDSKINTYVDDILNGNAHVYGRPPRVNHGHAHHTMRFRCASTKLASIGSPSIARRANGKMKFRRTVNSCSMQKRRRKRLKEVVLDRKSLNSKLALKGLAPSSSLGLSRDDSVSLIDQFNDTKEWYNSEELCNSSTTSPLLSRLMQKKNLPQSSKKLLSGIRRGDSSYTYSTPALSTTSFNRYFNYINPMSNGSWDGTTASLNGVDEDEAADPLDLPARQGCGIPCYWSRRSTPKYRGSYGVCSPSISDNLLRRKDNHRQYGSLSGMSKQRIVSGATQGHLPLLNSYDGEASSFGTGNSDDELSMNLVELDLEGMSRLDGRQWSFGCSSQEGLELMALAGDSQDGSTLENVRSLSRKYRPMFFDELVGQTIVVQSLMNALTRGRIAPVYLFQGPRGTGKTITAKIFAAALNCMATEGTKPCGICKKCSNSISCRSRDIMEVSGSNKKGIDSVRYVLKKLAVAPPSAISSYKVFVIDECHLLPSKTWAGLLKFIEDPLQQVVFIFITTDLDNIPRVILSRCQKHLFNKIKDVEIVSRLQRIATEENMDVEPHALELISLNADGSIRDAETMLEQLSLLGKRITATLVNELVGVVSDEKLIELLELAISSNTAETVKKARELLDSGADPLALMSQLATLIMDIIAGNYLLDGDKCSSSLYGGRSLTEEELEKFKNALKLLSEAEKQLRVCSERSTWFTATLLQLGSFTSPEFSLSGSSRRQSSKTTEEDQSTPSRSTSHEAQIVLSKSDMDKLDHLWLQCIEKCHYEKLRQLLQTYGKLISLSEVNGVLLAYIAFKDGNIKARAERYVISITNSLETVLRRRVEVRIVVLPDGLIPIASRDTKEEKSVTLPVASEGNDQVRGTKVPMQRIESIIREQRLETAWLQAVEKGGPLSINRSRPERNQVLPQDQVKSSSMDSELNKELKVSDKKDVVKDLMGIRAEHQPLSPSLLHQSKCPGAGLDKECQGYESGSGSKGCNILFCCYNKRSRTGKVTLGVPFRHHKGGQFLCFGECWRSRRS